ncbi:MAG: methyltransferase type 11 [Bacteroidetes bacterium GWE2_29_8]|nr:MAG: methyltransferase type 11 [Bacteroidetes bacterium GWE2_29_8]OFY20112.1 MAG: methyltransferase type 11 [Bacteroidetes bacterium GWF2_29_10]
MKYDPVKKTLGKIFNSCIFLRKLFYFLLDTLLLRTWHFKKEFNNNFNVTNSDIKIMDAGAGYGQYAFFLSSINKNWEITGAEIKDEQVEDCNNFFNKIGHNKVKFIIADLTNYVKENYYDLIVNVDVMEHIENDTDVMVNFYKSLKKGGKLLLSTPSDKGGSDAHDDDDESFVEEHVRNGYSVEDITDKLNRAGFEKIKVKYTYGIFGNIAWKLSMKIPLLILNISKIFLIILPFYYLITLPFFLILNYLDVITDNKEGTGLFVIAEK